ncbi:YciI family protein [Paenibacillus sp. SC116]|uniref:YciI family protein n=1 Tax=Paenibacillus sp. SC116 TaxID=2968986 RepID=UPI00215AEE3F|nr:YciI family protein [Paenibacillus sp. SC116]MCR8844645.1 YciI family protein [Paenibacillus sp. SC116]
MYLVEIRYTKAIDEVAQHLQAHLAFLDRYYAAGKFLLSGPFEPRDGGIIMIDIDDEDEVKRIISEDSFYQHQVTDYSLQRIRITRADACLKDRLPL